MVELAPEERRSIRRWVESRERFARAWRWQRWVSLGLSLSVLAVFAWMLHGLVDFEQRSVMSSIDKDLPMHPEIIRLEIRSEVMHAEARMRTYVSTVHFGIIGGILLAGILISWNRHKRFYLVTKIARQLLLESTGEMEKQESDGA